MTPTQVETLRTALAREFEAEVEAEKIAPKRYRFVVISPRFLRMSQLDRQDQVWRVVDDVLPREAALDISLILVYAPSELERAV